MNLMGITLNFKTGKPPYKGYYLARSSNPKYRIHKVKGLYPEPMYWNGEEWQDMSDNEAFDAPGNFKPIKFDYKFFDEWCEVEV